MIKIQKNINSNMICAWKKWLIQKDLKPRMVNSILRILKRAALRGAVSPSDIFLDLENINTYSIIK